MSQNPVFSFLDTNKKFYDVNCRILDFSKAPINGIVCHVLPGEKSEVHNHHEIEMFLFLSGSGLIHLNNEHFDVNAGVGVKVIEFKNHVIENTHTSEPLVFISLYWQELDNIHTVPVKDKKKRTLVFSTPPTPNGDLHAGHLSGPYLAADIYKRYLQCMQHSIMHVTGRDDNQTYVATKAQQMQLEPRVTADIFSDKILKTLKTYNIKLDYYIDPATADYEQFVKSKFQYLYDNQIIYEKTEPALYDSRSGAYLHEAYIRGTCPNCANHCDGNACEACGKLNNCTDLAGYNRNDTIIKDCKRLFFKLSAFESQLSEYIKATDISAHTKALALGAIEDGLTDICVSHPTHWGLSCPVQGFEDHIIYVWFEMAFGYLWAASQLAPATIKKMDDRICWYYNNSDAEILHFYGYDNSIYHTILFPAIYMALGLNNLPVAHIVNELLNLDGKKFSTSRNHLISGQDLSKELSIDSVRWYLCKVRPEGTRTNFILSQAKSEIDYYFNTIIEPWQENLRQILARNFDYIIPEPGAWTAEHQAYYLCIKAFFDAAQLCYQRGSFSPAQLTQKAEAFAVESIKFLNSQMHYFTLKSTLNFARTTIALSVLALKTLAELTLPITPDISKNMLDLLKQDTDKISMSLKFISPREFAA